MKIGILAYRQYPFISANTAIAYEVGQEITKSSKHEIVYIGRKQDKFQNQVNSHNGIDIKFLNKTVKKDTSCRLINIFKHIIGDSNYLFDAYNLKRIVKENNINVLICIIAPIDNALITYYAKLDIPVYLYQLDPFYNNLDIVNPKLKAKFTKVLKSCKHLFTTDLLYKEYVNDRELQSFVTKMSVLGFPKLVDKPSYSIDEEMVPFKNRLIYAGSLYHEIRSPQILIDLKKLLTDDFKLIFCGGCDRTEDMEALRDSGIVCKGYCSQEVLDKEIQNSSYLINIGNKVRNQLGSKIVDYVSTGKSIINLFQFDECPTVAFLRNYSLKINIHINELNDIKTKEKIINYINNTQDKRLSFKDVEKTYWQYTPTCVARSILDKFDENI